MVTSRTPARHHAKGAPVGSAAARRHRIPAPLVVALASVLVSSGVVVLVLSRLDAAATETPAAAAAAHEPRPGTPEGAALAFVNAWQTFRYERARALSTGDARARVEQTLAREAAYSDEQREIAEQLRTAMRSLECRLASHQQESVGDGRTIVRASIRCSGAGSSEFSRDDVYTVLREGGSWKVAAWEPGPRRSP